MIQITSKLIIDLDVEMAESIDEPFLGFNKEEMSFLPKRCCLTSNISVNIYDKESSATTSADKSYSDNNMPNYEYSDDSLSNSSENNIYYSNVNEFENYSAQEIDHDCKNYSNSS